MKKLALFLAFLLLLTAAFSTAMAQAVRVPQIHINEPVPDDWYSRDLLRLTVFKIAQNDAMLLECGGKRMLIDGGVGTHASSIRDSLKELGADHLDYFFNSHPHDDHIQNVYWMLKHDYISGDEFLSPFPKDEPRTAQREMVAVLDAHGIPYTQWMKGEVRTMGAAQLTLMRVEGESYDLNYLSGVLHVRFGNATMLLTADLTGEGQHWFLEHYSPEWLHVDVLKAPHHALTNMVPDFIRTVAPALTFFTNMRGETEKQSRQVYKYGSELLYNSMGRITMETDGEVWYISQKTGVV